MIWLGIFWLVSLAIVLFCWIFIIFWGVILVVIWVYLFGFLVFIFFLDKIFLFIRILLSIIIWCCLEKIWSLGNFYWIFLVFI